MKFQRDAWMARIKKQIKECNVLPITAVRALLHLLCRCLGGSQESRTITMNEYNNSTVAMQERRAIFLGGWE